MKTGSKYLPTVPPGQGLSLIQKGIRLPECAKNR